MARPVLLDLFCGAGGAAMGYHLAGFDVIGVDHCAQPRYPFRFVRGDALVYLESHQDVDAIHASPPCQAFSAATRRNRAGRESAERQLTLVPRHLDLVSETRTLLEASGLPYVIENVEGAPLRNPQRLCGSSFGLDLRRHRLFEANWPLHVPPCDHGWQTPRFRAADTRMVRRGELMSVLGVYGHLSYAGEWDHWQRAMGIDWMTPNEITQAIPPAYTQWIGRQLLTRVNVQAKAS